MDCGSSSILPNGRCSVLPVLPTDGQVFVDSELVKWIYNASTDLWEKSGTATTVPVATSDNIGYLSSVDKTLLDKTPAVPGGFGIITDTKLLLQSPTNPEGIIRGDIELKSESLDITCVGSNGLKLTCAVPPELECTTPTGTTPGLSFKLSKKFLDTFIVNMPGPQGKKGLTGEKGKQGKPGFSGGPPGIKGLPGSDIDELCKLTGISYRDLDGVTETAIVDLNLVDDNGHGCKLAVTKARLNVPGDVPADKVIATPLVRNIVYDTDPDPSVCNITRLDQWRLVQNPGDDTPLNLSLLRLSRGADSVSDEPVGFNTTLSLRKFISDIVSEYKRRLQKIDKEFGKIARDYIEKIDDKARSILSQLANDVAMCEFNLPAVEYCITFTGCDQPPPPPPPPPPPSPFRAASIKASDNTETPNPKRKVSSVVMGARKWGIKQ